MKSFEGTAKHGGNYGSSKFGLYQFPEAGVVNCAASLDVPGPFGDLPHDKAMGHTEGRRAARPRCATTVGECLTWQPRSQTG
ncbi:hypothetical protein SBA4_3990009 [Candidatus Sulfopaludibacter sp. SbA4]|nr:hypothetical protein SBA4_3990009 [Candidatus Sulfopaludibacter sp. SbA4]